jgi:enamine deaminase RidA (YjgF/YER057c/UK114 family)
MTTIDLRLRRHGITVPDPFPPMGRYLPAVQVGDLLFLSGTGPVRPDGTVVTGKVGRDLDLDAAREAARLTGLQVLAALTAELGSLDRVRRVVKVLGMVNAAPGFTQAPQVIDGCSELLIDVFGDAGWGARSAIGVAELPVGIAVEVEAVVQVAPDGAGPG